MSTIEKTPLLRLHVRGLEIDAQCGKSGVVNLVVRADQQHKGIWRRFCQHLAHALFRAGDACNTGNDNRALRVVLRPVSGTTVDDGLPDWANPDISEVWPLHSANGDANYIALLVHEGVKRHHDGRPAARDGGCLGGQKGADDAHGGSLVKNPIITPTIIVCMPAGKGKTAIAKQMMMQFGCTAIVDEWNPGMTLVPGAVHLSNVGVGAA